MYLSLASHRCDMSSHLKNIAVICEVMAITGKRPQITDTYCNMNSPWAELCVGKQPWGQSRCKHRKKEEGCEKHVVNPVVVIAFHTSHRQGSLWSTHFSVDSTCFSSTLSHAQTPSEPIKGGRSECVCDRLGVCVDARAAKNICFYPLEASLKICLLLLTGDLWPMAVPNTPEPQVAQSRERTRIRDKGQRSVCVCVCVFLSPGERSIREKRRESWTHTDSFLQWHLCVCVCVIVFVCFYFITLLIK